MSEVLDDLSLNEYRDIDSEQLENPSHSIDTFLISSSILLERAAYYGLRSLLVLYMTGEALKMTTEDAFVAYGWISGSLIVSGVLGAILGDLIIGNKNAAILGGIIQAIGAFALIIPSTSGLYVGLALVVSGGGLNSPNIRSHFGKGYLRKIKIVDAGFILFYLAVNLGAFFGIMWIGFVGEAVGYRFGFGLAGIIFLISVIPLFWSKKVKNSQFVKQALTMTQRVLKIVSTMLIVGLFWSIYEIAGAHIMDIQSKLSGLSTDIIPSRLWPSLNLIFLIPISIAAIIFWTIFHHGHLFKLTLGFVFCALSYGIIYSMPDSFNQQHVVLFLISSFCLGIAEICISPIILALIIKYANPKYLAIIMSLTFVPSRLINRAIGFMYGDFYDVPQLAIAVSFVAAIVISAVLFILIIIKMKPRK